MNTYKTGTFTRTGRSHENSGRPNEDRAVVVQQAMSVWMGVFDGVSQGGGGAMAATIAAQSMETVISELENTDIYETGLKIIARAQASILETGRKHPEYGKMQTTGVVACIDQRENILTCFSIGDSAAFVCSSKGRLKKLTVEDTDIGMMLSQGRISKREASKIQGGHELNKWIGMENVPAESMSDMVRCTQIPLKHNDSVLLCSDGFYGCMKAKKIIKLMKEELPPESFVKEALKCGSKDDITVVIAKPENRRQPKMISLSLSIALTSFCFAGGLFLGSWFGSLQRAGYDVRRPDIKEMTEKQFPADTITIKNIEYATD